MIYTNTAMHIPVEWDSQGFEFIRVNIYSLPPIAVVLVRPMFVGQIYLTGTNVDFLEFSW